MKIIYELLIQVELSTNLVDDLKTELQKYGVPTRYLLQR